MGRLFLALFPAAVVALTLSAVLSSARPVFERAGLALTQEESNP